MVPKQLKWAETKGTQMIEVKVVFVHIMFKWSGETSF